MSIQYALYENNLNTAKANTYTAKVKSYQTVTEEVLIDELAQRGTTLTKTDLKAVMTLLSDAIEQHLALGNSINLPFANFIPVIKGVFSASDDIYDEKRHALSVSVSLGNRLRKFSKLGVSCKKIRLPKPRPAMDNFIDCNTETQDTLITPGGLAKILGYRLIFDDQDPDQGVFFKSSDKKSTPVIKFALIRAKVLVFTVPKELQRGTYTVEIRTKFGSILREGTLKTKLKVV